MVSSPSLQCCSPRRPLLMLSLACRLDTHAAVAVRRRTSLLDVGDLGALGPAPWAVCAPAVSPLGRKSSGSRGRKTMAILRGELISQPKRCVFRMATHVVTQLANSARSVVSNLLLLPLDAVDAP